MSVNHDKAAAAADAVLGVLEVHPDFEEILEKMNGQDIDALLGILEEAILESLES